MTKPARPVEAHYLDDEVVIFDPPPPSELKCAVCLDLFRDPVLTRCGHSFCRKCILGQLQSSGVCPMCRRSCLSAGELAPNLLARTMVEELSVRCIHGCYESAKDGWTVDDEYGCPVVLKFGLRKAHSKSCEYAPTRCPSGGSRCPPVARVDLEEHLKDECQYAGRDRKRKAARASGDIDWLEMGVAGGLVLFFLLAMLVSQSRLRHLVREAAWPLLLIIGGPLAAFGAVLLIERVYNRRRQKALEDDE